MLLPALMSCLVTAPWFFRPSPNESQSWIVELPSAGVRDTAIVAFTEPTPGTIVVSERLGREPLFVATSLYSYSDALGLVWTQTSSSCDSAKTRIPGVCAAIDSLPRRNLSFTLVGNLGGNIHGASESHDSVCRATRAFSINIKTLCTVVPETLATEAGSRILTRHDYGMNDVSPPYGGWFDTTRFDEQGRCVYATVGRFRDRYSYWIGDTKGNHTILRATRWEDSGAITAISRRTGMTQRALPSFRDMAELRSWFQASGIAIHSIATISGGRVSGNDRPGMVLVRTNQGTRRAMVGIRAR